MICGILALRHNQNQPTFQLRYQRGRIEVAEAGGKYVAVNDPLMGCDVEDTTLDNAEPTKSEGGLYSLSGGTGKTILIRFGQLQRLLGAHAKVLDAKIIFTQSSPDTPQLTTFGELLRPWGEGPALTLNLPHLGPATAPVKPPSLAVSRAPIGGATWLTSEFGIKGAKWSTPGAMGPQDIQVLPVKAHPTGTGNFVVEGLAPQIQKFVEKPWLNFGFALQFSGPCEFASSEDGSAQPQLEITYVKETEPTISAAKLEIVGVSRAPGSDALTVEVSNLGKGPSSPCALHQLMDGISMPVANVPSLSAGATFKADLPCALPNPQDPRAGKINFWLGGNQASAEYGSAVFFPNGFAIPVQSDLPKKEASKLLLKLSSLCNKALDRSRFSFSPAGCMERIQLQPDLGQPGTGDLVLPLKSGSLEDPHQLKKLMQMSLEAAGATDFGKEQIADSPLPLDQKNGFYGGGTYWYGGLLGGDRRYEGQLPPSLQLPQQAYQVPYLLAVPSSPYGPLGLVTVGQLNDLVSKPTSQRNPIQPSAASQFPHLILVRAYGANGFTLKNSEMDFYRVVDGKVSPTKEFSLKTDQSGSALLPNQPMSSGGSGRNPFGTNRLEGDGSFAVHMVLGNSSGWALMTASSMLESAYRGDQTVAFCDLHFALPSQPIDQSQNYAENAAVTQADAASDPSSIQLGPSNQWAEWDLHRDRRLGEIDIVFTGKPSAGPFKVLVYNTGETVQNAIDWSSEPDLAWTIANRSQPEDGNFVVRYYGPIVTARFIRIEDSEGKMMKISKIAVFSPTITQK